MLKNFKKFKTWENWHDLHAISKVLRVKPLYFLIPACLAMMASFFEAVSLGLLIPTVRGIIEADFNFVRSLPVFETVITWFPDKLGNRNATIFALLVASIFSAASLKNGFDYIANLSTVVLVRKFANGLRKQVYAQFLSFNKLYFDKHSLGHLHEILMGHTSAIVMQMTRLKYIFQSVFSLFIYLGLMLFISWKLTVFVLLAFPVLSLSLKWLIYKISKTSEFFSEAYLKVGSKISNALSCIPLVKAYTHEEKEQSWFNQATDRITRLEISMDKKYLLIAPIQEMILLCMMLLLVVMMALLFVRQGQGDIAGYMVFVVVLRRSMGTLSAYNEMLGVLATIRGPIKEILKTLKGNDEYLTADGHLEFEGLTDKIEFKNVCFSYRKNVPVLNGVSLSIKKGEMTAIVGSTGAGKTTLTNLIMRFYDPVSGQILFDDNEVKNFSLKSLRSNVAWVSQETYLFNASLKINLIYGLDEEVSEEKLMEALKKSRLYDFIMKLPDGLETEVGDKGIRLSGGEKQRVAIARAFLKGADILILDEATSSLDSETEKLIQDALDEVVKGRTSIVIAHRLSTIRHADKIIVVKNGKVCEEGPLEELLKKKGRFYDYWQHQNFF